VVVALARDCYENLAAPSISHLVSILHFRSERLNRETAIAALAERFLKSRPDTGDRVELSDPTRSEPSNLRVGGNSCCVGGAPGASHARRR
jgi:hypothetical protein